MIDTNASSLREQQEALREQFEQLSKDYKVRDALDFWLAHRFMEAMSDLLHITETTRPTGRGIGASSYIIRAAMMATADALFDAIERTVPGLCDVQLPGAEAEDMLDLLCKHFGEDPAVLR